MVCCSQATSHYLSQCWPSSLSPCGVTRPQWVKPCDVWFMQLSTCKVVSETTSTNLHICVVHECSFYEFHCDRSFSFLNTLRPRRNRRHFADDIFKCILLNENVLISIKISLKFIPKGPINNIPALVQIMAWRWPGNKPLSEPMMIISLTHICFTLPHWVNTSAHKLV